MTPSGGLCLVPLLNLSFHAVWRASVHAAIKGSCFAGQLTQSGYTQQNNNGAGLGGAYVGTLLASTLAGACFSPPFVQTLRFVFSTLVLRNYVMRRGETCSPCCRAVSNSC